MSRGGTKDYEVARFISQLSVVAPKQVRFTFTRYHVLDVHNALAILPIAFKYLLEASLWPAMQSRSFWTLSYSYQPSTNSNDT